MPYLSNYQKTRAARLKYKQNVSVTLFIPRKGEIPSTQITTFDASIQNTLIDGLYRMSLPIRILKLVRCLSKSKQPGIDS